MKDARQPLHVTQHLCLTAAIRDAAHYTDGNLDILHGDSFVIAATAGSKAAHEVGAGLVLWHPAHGAFYGHWFGVEVCASDSTDAKWLAKMILMLVVGNRLWWGTVHLASDSTASMMANVTKSLPTASRLSFLFLVAIIQLHTRPSETWLPAQPDIGAATLLAALNAISDELADRVARSAEPNTLP